MDLGLRDEVAAISGGSAGIGQAIAEGLANEGVHLALCAREEERLSSTAEQLREKHGVRILGVKTDVAKKVDTGYFVGKVKKEFGLVDILVNNAGTGSEEKIMDAPDEKWQSHWGLLSWLQQDCHEASFP